MLLATVTSVAFLGFVPAASASPPTSATPGQKPPPSYAEALASPDWVPTPVGLAYKSCLHEVPDGSFISEDGVVSVNGVVIETLPTCPYAGIVPVPHSPQAEAALAQAALNGEKNHGASAGKDGSIPRAEQGEQALASAAAHGTKNHGVGGAANGASGATDQPAPIPWAFPNDWWLQSWWLAPAQITSFSAQWVVPPNPTLTGALVYLFPSISYTPTYAYIVQPVLQWGVGYAGGWSDAWCIVSWFYHDKYSLAYTTPVKTVAGHTIRGSMSRANGATSVWTITTHDVTAGVARSVSATTGVTNWRDAQGGVLEVYYANSCKQLPNGSVTFTGYSMQTTSGTVTPGFYVDKTNSSCYGTTTASSVSTKLSWSTTA